MSSFYYYIMSLLAKLYYLFVQDFVVFFFVFFSWSVVYSQGLSDVVKSKVKMLARSHDNIIS